MRNEGITCKVVSEKVIDFRGVQTSLSSAASELLRELGWKAPQVQGPIYWLYNGETLDERRQRIESQD